MVRGRGFGIPFKNAPTLNIGVVVLCCLFWERVGVGGGGIHRLHDSGKQVGEYVLFGGDAVRGEDEC